MPELPEVETIVSDLNQVLSGLEIKKIIVHEGYEPKTPKLYSAIGASVSSVERVGKTIHLVLEDGRRVVFHLTMTGQLLLRRPGDVPDLHQRITFIFSKGRQLRFTDLRMFGWVDFLEEEEIGEFTNRYGPDPFEVEKEEFARRILSKKTSIKNALLDQKLISGIGNIYANDALWIAEIHPEARTHKLSGQQLQVLHDAVVEILKEGIKHRGSSIDTYVDAFGQPGRHQNHFRVYGKEGEECMRCGGEIEFSKVGGRGTFYCEGCQVKGLGKGKAPTEQVKGQATLEDIV